MCLIKCGQGPTKQTVPDYLFLDEPASSPAWSVDKPSLVQDLRYDLVQTLELVQNSNSEIETTPGPELKAAPPSLLPARVQNLNFKCGNFLTLFEHICVSSTRS